MLIAFLYGAAMGVSATSTCGYFPKKVLRKLLKMANSGNHSATLSIQRIKG